MENKIQKFAEFCCQLFPEIIQTSMPRVRAVEIICAETEKLLKNLFQEFYHDVLLSNSTKMPKCVGARSIATQKCANRKLPALIHASPIGNFSRSKSTVAVLNCSYMASWWVHEYEHQLLSLLGSESAATLTYVVAISAHTGYSCEIFKK